jgi:hypothetical protein
MMTVLNGICALVTMCVGLLMVEDTWGIAAAGALVFWLSWA